MPFYKYPRTQHIEGSRLQAGDADLESVPFARIAGRMIVVEEKVDGANSGISFTSDGKLQTQSRGHFLTGGPREAHFSLLKQWAAAHCEVLWQSLGDRYIVYGEWLYAKHTIFYDALPHYFLEFDVLDVESGTFLSMQRREKLLRDLPVVSVPVLYSGSLSSLAELTSFVGPSRFIRPGHLERLTEHAGNRQHNVDRIHQATDRSTMMEGLYIKVEEDGVVTERYKYVRADFLAAVACSDGHWLDRPVLPNLLRDDARLFER